MTTETTALAVTGEQLALIKRTVASGATDDELKLYLYDCARHGVHPLDKLLHFTKRGGKYTPITSIDLMRTRAAEADCLGISDPSCAGVPKDPDFAATVTVKRLVKDQIAEFTATARWSEYCPPAGQNHMWVKMPHTMLGKCAEALALRKGFPKQLAGLYAREEMDQAGVNTVTGEIADAPEQAAPPLSDPPRPAGVGISEPQRKRLFAIAKSHGWENDEVAQLVATCGFQSTKDITRGEAYENICARLEGPPPADEPPDEVQAEEIIF